jgi:lysozyme
MNLLGIDVSVNNGDINWDLIKLDPQQIKFAYIKTSQGVGYADPKRAENAYGASHAGIRFGYYHFASLNSVNVEKDARSEAQYFISILKNLPVSTLPVVIDVETNEVKLSQDNVQLWIGAFLMEMIHSGYPKVMIYSGLSFLNTNLPKYHKFGTTNLWLAQYASRFDVPHGFNKVSMWQFTCKGKVMGIKTDVDMNRSDLNF